jgi:hypothetical protein
MDQTMRGREFLDLAKEVHRGGTEVHRRGTVIHAYYALMLECRDAQMRWGLTVPRYGAHAVVRLKFVYSKDTDLQDIAKTLDRLVQLRNQASYNLGPLAEFASDARAHQAIRDAGAALTLLAAIDGDPVRRAAAIASMPP